jgi:hypothetical protein
VKEGLGDIMIVVVGGVPPQYYDALDQDHAARWKAKLDRYAKNRDYAMVP